jgi:hypothetical protein
MLQSAPKDNVLTILSIGDESHSVPFADYCPQIDARF